MRDAAPRSSTPASRGGGGGEPPATPPPWLQARSARLGLGAALLLLGLAAGGRVTALPRAVSDAEQALADGDLAAAEARWRAVLALAPGDDGGLYGLGWTLHLAGERALAREAFTELVDRHPESALGYKGLGSVAMAEGNPGLARRRFEEALARAPADPAIRHSLALLALRSGQGDEAIVGFEALVTEAPEEAAFRQGLAEALLVAGRAEDAVTSASEALGRAKTPREEALAHFTRARAILAATGGRVDAEDCAGTAPPVYAWLEEADRALDRAEATGIPLPELSGARRAVRQRRGAVDDRCPGLRAGGADVGRKFPDG